MNSEWMTNILSYFDASSQDTILVGAFEIIDQIFNITKHTFKVLENDPLNTGRFCDALKVVIDKFPEFVRMGNDPAFLGKFENDKMNHFSAEAKQDFEFRVKKLHYHFQIILPILTKLHNTARISLHDILIHFVNLAIPLLSPAPQTPQIYA